MEITFTIDRPYGRVECVLEVFEEDGVTVCGVFKLRGRIGARRRWFKIVQGHLRRIERIARSAGCAEMRVAGRNWTRVLPDYEPLSGLRNGLRKVL